MKGLQRRALNDRQVHERKILDQLEANLSVTQRSLASELGIALGLTNLLMRRLVKKGWVRITRISPRRIRYLITPAGIAAKAQLTRDYFLNSLSFYRETRERVRERLALVSGDLQTNGGGPHGVVFYGAGDVAEVAYVCLQEARLELLGVVDPVSTRPFFAVPVHRPSELARDTLAGRAFSRLIVMPLQDEDEVRSTLSVRQVPADSVFWL
jgi:DNA-binding MarR family transcriptional regulator